MRVTLKTPNPHSEQQRILMEAFFLPDILEIYFICGTKFGKTLGAAVGLSAKAWVSRGAILRWIAPIYSQSKIGMRYCKKALPKGHFQDKTREHPMIEFPQLDTFIEYWHGKNPEDLEGEGPIAMVLDEAAKMKQQVYDSAHTTTTVTRAPKLITTTPRGKNWVHKKAMAAKAKMEYQIKNGLPITHMYITAPTAANPHVPRASIEEAARSLPDRLFRQYYLAEFVDDGDVFTGYLDCIYGEDEIDDQSKHQFWIWDGYEATEDHKADVDVVIGADWGKHHDYTVFTAWDFKQRRLCGFLRFRGMDYHNAVKMLCWFVNKFRQCEMINHDKTGIGDVIDEMLDRTTLPAEGVIFSNRSKSYMVNTFMVGIEQGAAKLPNWLQMKEELDSFEVRTNELGNMIYSASEGMHDDIVCSMILGWAAVEEFAEQSLVATAIEDLPNMQNGTSAYEDYIKQIEEEIDDERFERGY